MLGKGIIKKLTSKINQLKTIQMQILLYFSIVIISVILILDIVFYYLSVNVIRNDAKEYTNQITSQIGRNIDYYVKYMEDISLILNNAILVKNNVTGVIKSNSPTSSVLFKTIKGTRTDIVSIFVFGKNGVILSDQDNYKIKSNIKIQDFDFYKNAIAAKGNPVFSSSHVQNFIKDQYPWVVSLSKAIYNSDTKELEGVSLIDINYKVFTDLCSKIQLGSKGYIFILDNKGEMIYHPKQQLIYSGINTEKSIPEILSTNQGSFTEFSDGDEKLMTVYTLPSIGWKVVGVTYIGDIVIQKEDMMRAIFFITIICLVIGTIISIQVASTISNPLKQLEKIMRQVETGELNFDISIKGNNEIAHLAQTFSVMVRRIKRLLIKISEDKDALRKSEFNTLYSQINPHFLYNSLDTIIWAAETGENENVVKMTSALSKYFRLSLSRGKEIISIFHEIEQVKNYLIIQKIRYDKKLEYEIDVDKDIFMYGTIKILLQPIVENSIYHGIKNLPNGGKVWILGKKVGKNIHLIVKDNGTGIEVEELKNILVKKDANPLTTGGVALININDRIQLYYGKEYGITFESKAGEGTTVTVIIPIIEEGVY